MTAPMTNDIVLVDKPVGLSSFGVVARVRRVLSESSGRKVKVGHTGTLDPFASGLMILLTGAMCRQAEQFSKLDKVYQTEIRLGQSSTTGDPEGEISFVSEIQPTVEEVGAVLAKYTGRIEQTPPVYSAIKIGGQRAYKLAREGQQVVMPTRWVDIYETEVVRYDYPILEIWTHVSSGTYIRSLAEDIGKALGTDAYCSSLRRLKVGDYSIEQAKKLEDLGISS